MELLLTWILLLNIAKFTDSSAVKILNVGDSCTSNERHKVNNDKKYKIVWNSEDIPDNCRFRFSAQGDVTLDDFKVCVEATDYALADCNIQLSYFLGFDGYPEKTFSCLEKPTQECGRVGEYFDVEIAKKNSRLPVRNSRFTLEVTAMQLYDHSERQGFVGAIIGGVIGGIALLVIVTVIIIIVNRRQRSNTGYVYNARGHTNMAMNNAYQPGSQPYSYPTYPVHKPDATMNDSEPNSKPLQPALREVTI